MHSDGIPKRQKGKEGKKKGASQGEGSQKVGCTWRIWTTKSEGGRFLGCKEGKGRLFLGTGKEIGKRAFVPQRQAWGGLKFLF